MEIKSFPTVMFGNPVQFQSALHDGLKDSGIYLPEHENTKSAQDIIHHIETYFKLTESVPVGEQGNAGKAVDKTGEPASQQQPTVPQGQPQPPSVNRADPIPGANGGANTAVPDLDDAGEADTIVEEEDGGSARADVRDIVAATVQVCTPGWGMPPPPRMHTLKVPQLSLETSC